MKKYELTADMTENRQYIVLEKDGEDWRSSLKVRKKVRNNEYETLATIL